MLAVVRFTQHFRHYLLGQAFILRTDHNSLRWLMNFRDLQGQLARWLEVLSQYNMEIRHRSGNKHVNADVLSRYQPDRPYKEMSIHIDPSELPCSGCKHCTKVHQSWSAFAKEIDDVIPLSHGVVQKCTISDLTDRSERDRLATTLEMIRRQTDNLESSVEERVKMSRLVSNPVNSQRSRRELRRHLVKQIGTLKVKVEELVRQLPDLANSPVSIMERFRDMTYKQLRNLWVRLDKSEHVVEKKRQNIRRYTKPSLATVSEENEQVTAIKKQTGELGNNS